jgi:hypothetical protein
MLPAMFDEVVSMSGASPVTVTVSCTPETPMSRFNIAVRPSSSSTPGRITVVNPASSALIRYRPARTGNR